MITRVLRCALHVDGRVGRPSAPSSSAGRRQPVIFNPLQFALGGMILAAGLGFYYYYRTTPIAVFEYAGIQPIPVPVAPAMAYFLVNSFPSLIHCLSLSLLLGSLVRPGYRRYIGVCLFWLLIDVLFEAAQAYGSTLVAAIPGNLGSISLFDPIADYLRFGTYDPGDIVAILFGAVIAYIILVLTGMRQRSGRRG